MHRRALRFTVLPLILFALTGCQILWGEPPGEGWKARDGMRKAVRVIVALQQFRQAQGHYPRRLVELIPRYVPDRSAISYASNGMFQYIPDHGGYTLQFSYSTGLVTSIDQCVYDSRTRKWNCGHF